MGDTSPLQMGRSDSFPLQLRCVFHETFLGNLSEKFSASSHDGPYDIALEVGTTLTALHRLIYPQNYPQIGSFFLLLSLALVPNAIFFEQECIYWNLRRQCGTTGSRLIRRMRSWRVGRERLWFMREIFWLSMDPKAKSLTVLYSKYRPWANCCQCPCNIGQVTICPLVMSLIPAMIVKY
jgi:hypothetical protein